MNQTFGKWFTFNFKTLLYEVHHDQIRMTAGPYRALYMQSFIDRLRVAQPRLQLPPVIDHLSHLAVITGSLELLTEQSSRKTNNQARLLAVTAFNIITTVETDLKEYSRLRLHCPIGGDKRLSAPREPAKWRQLLSDNEIPASETQWRKYRKDYKLDMIGTRKCVRITRWLADHWGLQLPEFEDPRI
jgi:hypothetical protein